MKVRGAVRVKAYSVISDAVERGLGIGWGRVWKHRDGAVGEDDRDAVLETLEHAVLTELGEVLEFDGGADDIPQ